MNEVTLATGVKITSKIAIETRGIMLRAILDLSPGGGQSSEFTSAACACFWRAHRPEHDAATKQDLLAVSDEFMFRAGNSKTTDIPVSTKSKFTAIEETGSAAQEKFVIHARCPTCGVSSAPTDTSLAIKLSFAAVLLSAATLVFTAIMFFR